MLKLFGALFAAGKLGKLFISGGSMLLTVILYSWVYGWKYAIGFVLLILIHEMGHFGAARLCGMQVGLPTFIPFVGAWIELKDQAHTVETEAYIAFAGPIAGTAAALICYWLGRQFDSDLLLALSYSGFIINLLNLIPISPLDGGRITAIISPKVWLLGVPLLVALFLYRPSPMLILIGILAYPQLKLAFSNTVAEGLPEGYYEVAFNTRVNYGVMYLCLVVFLALMSYELHEALPTAHF